MKKRMKEYKEPKDGKGVGGIVYHPPIQAFGEKGSPHKAHSLKSWTEGVVHMEAQLQKEKPVKKKLW